MYLPRERLRQKGVEVLSDYELLALLFRTGTKEQDVLEMSKNVLKDIGGCDGLGAGVSLQRLCTIRGIGEGKASAILAAIELGKRVYQSSNKKSIFQITNPADCFGYFKAELKYLKQEVFIVVLLDTKNQIIRWREVYRGGLQNVEVHPREIFKAALEVSAAGMILIHNHPSGDPVPSRADIHTTKILVAAGELMGVPILDHIIIAGETYKSLKASGELD